MKKTILILILIAGSAFCDSILSFKVKNPEIFTLSYTQLWLETFGEGPVFYQEGPMFEIEAGLGGFKINVGKASGSVGGGTVKASLFKTWGDPIYIEPNQLYFGGEIDLQFNHFIASIGAYYHIHGEDEDRKFISTAGVGFCFAF